MSLQLITSDEMTNINLSGSIVYSDEHKIIALINSNMLTEKEHILLENETAFLFSFSHDQDCIKTKDHYIQTAKIDGGALEGLTGGQWLIRFDL